MFRKTCLAAALPLISAALPQGGSESDMESLPKIEEKLKKEEHLPEELFADAGYGSDENYVKSAENGVKLIAPTAHQPKDKVGLNECKFDEKKVYCGMSAEKQMPGPEMRETESRVQVYGCGFEDSVPPKARSGR